MSFLQLRTTRGKSGDFVAKKNKEIIENEADVVREEKAPGFFKKMLFLGLIPLVFTVAIVLIVAQLTNINVFKLADEAVDKIPFISKNEEVVENAALSEEKVVELQAEIQQKEVEISQLQAQIDASTTEKDALLVEQERLLFEIEKLKRNQQETQKEFQEILTTFNKMSAKTAAPILMEMSDTETLRILSEMKPDKLSEILTKMPAAEAARYTELLAQQ